MGKLPTFPNPSFLIYTPQRSLYSSAGRWRIDSRRHDPAPTTPDPDKGRKRERNEVLVSGPCRLIHYRCHHCQTPTGHMIKWKSSPIAVRAVRFRFLHGRWTVKCSLFERKHFRLLFSLSHCWRWRKGRI